MNKAFIRETDEPEPRCPGCGTLGVTVSWNTLRANLPEARAGTLGEFVWYCQTPRCAVAYYDSAGLTVGVEHLRQRAYPKHTEAPICSCFGVTAEQIEADARAGDPTRVRDLIARAKTGEARCAATSPSGQCCVAQVQRVYLGRRKVPLRGDR